PQNPVSSVAYRLFDKRRLAGDAFSVNSSVTGLTLSPASRLPQSCVQPASTASDPLSRAFVSGEHEKLV
ncbi:hypothetical protein, partial [Pseudomonas viridiflava]|uniref:hypothetical protein n=1 Tax=Pseudomonas viridiflava TaxID=33069 RepID=UPI001C1090C8